ncbi:MAG: hypothetical protein ABIF08_03405 [Nanoarchaeota archaeon]
MLNHIDAIASRYRETLLQTKKSLMEIIQNDIKMKDGNTEVFMSIVEQSMEGIINNWVSGKKYTRTLFMGQVMGDMYPQEAVELSLSVDSIINILDDILDENLDKNTNAAYIVEIIRILAVFTSKLSDETQRKSVENYFNKIISIAIGEQVYKNMIKNENNPEKIIDLITEVYACRSLDMDIFVELPLLEISLSPSDVSRMLVLGRHFRTLNLIKKDIDDIERDRIAETETGVTLSIEKGNPIEILRTITERVVADSKQINLDEQTHLADNFKKMIENEKQEINKRLERIKY